jgi:hypothetical protein
MARNDEPGQAKQRKGTSGSGKWSKYQPKSQNGELDWSKVDEAAILIALSNVTKEGAALLFGKTRDGGALVLTVCDGDERLKLYATTHEEMGVHLREVADA